MRKSHIFAAIAALGLGLAVTAYANPRQTGRGMGPQGGTQHGGMGGAMGHGAGMAMGPSGPRAGMGPNAALPIRAPSDTDHGR